MPKYRSEKSIKTGAAIGAAFYSVIIACASNAQESDAMAPARAEPVTRGVVVLPGQPKPPLPKANPARCDRPIVNADIRIDRFENGTDKFDRELSRKLKTAKETVSLDIAKPWSAESDAPPMIGRWLEEIKASGGKISSMQYCQKNRGLFSFFGNLIKRKPIDRFAAIKAYDAILQINGADQMITQILLRRRKPS